MDRAVLITAGAGKTKETLEAVRELGEVREAHTVTGPYDIVAVVEAETMEELGDVISRKISPKAERVVACLRLP